MKALLVFLLFSTPAVAANTIQMALTNDIPATAGTVSKTFTLPQGDMNKLLTWIQAAFVCAPVPPATTCTAYTQQQAVQAWMKSVIDGTKDNVYNAEKAKASSDATSGVAPINPQ